MTDIDRNDQDLDMTGGFRWGEVPPGRTHRRVAGVAADQPEAALADAGQEPEPDLGGIAGFVGSFTGTGLNTIFRPQNFALSPTPLPNPANGPDDNILEINLTEETLEFSA